MPAESPLGDDGFVEKLEEMLGRVLRKMKPGRKPGRGHYESMQVRCSLKAEGFP